MKNSPNSIFLRKCAFALSLLLLTGCLYVLTNKQEATNQPQATALSSAATTDAPNKALVAPPVAQIQTEGTRTLTPPPFVAQKTSEGTPQYFGSFEAKNAEKEENDASSVGERLQFEFDMLKDPATGKIPKGISEKSLIAAAQAPVFESQWSSSGSSAALDIPGMTIEARGNNLGGRTRAIGIDKRDANVMLAGSVSSGIFRTTNGGASWTRVVPIGQIHNVTAIAQDTRAGEENTWYFGGGEGSGNSTSLGSSYRGYGIWKSTDNGVTWAQLPSTISGTTLESFDSPFDYVHRIVVDPTNGNVYAAAGVSIMRSANGGTTWAAALGAGGASTTYSDIIVTPTGRFYAAIAGSDANEGVWTSTTGASASWTKIAGTISAVVTPATWNAASGYGRVVINYAPSNPDIVFALYYNNVTSDCAGTVGTEAELFKYDRATTTWTDLSANLPDEAGCLNGNDPFAVQGGYDLAVAVKPDDINTVFIAGTNVYRSTNGFTSTAATTRIGGYVSPASYGLYLNHHPDVHTLVFALGDNNTLYTGDDGGIQKANITATPVVWTALNTDYVTYQYYHVDISPTAASDVIVGGAQDNGSTLNDGGTGFDAIRGGDGCAIGIMSYTSPTSFSIMSSTQRGSLGRLSSPGFGTFGLRPSTAGTGIFVTYFNLDQDNRTHLYYADFANLYRTRIASTIAASTVGTDASTGWERMTGAGISGDIRSMANSRNNAYAGNTYSATNANRKLYIGTSTGKVYRLNDPAFVAATTAATDITPVGAPSAIVSSISINPYNDNEIMVTYSNYASNSVYHTTNANSATPTWANVEGAAGTAVQLASARSSVIVKLNNVTHYFVGTSVGLFCTNALSGATTVWSRVGSTDINFAVISQMRYRPSDNKILVGTHGNGMFMLTLPGVAIPIELMAFDGKGTQEGNKITWTTASERAIDGYEVQRSNSGEKNSFETIGFVKGTNTTSRQTYNFLDDKAATTTPQYYRLKVVEQSASKSAFTKIITIEPSAKRAALDFVVAPNPVANDMQIVFENTPLPDFTINIVDYTGRVVRTQAFQSFTDKAVTLPMSNLASGTYLARIVSPTGSVKTVKFFKL